jgi:hypothetical protein
VPAPVQRIVTQIPTKGYRTTTGLSVHTSSLAPGRAAATGSGAERKRADVSEILD